MSDVTVRAKGDAERLAYLFDRRRVTPSGLAGEIVPDSVLPGSFSLVTIHIRCGDKPVDRVAEPANVEEFAASEIRDRAGGEADDLLRNEDQQRSNNL